jgi:hypothetical protein
MGSSSLKGSSRDHPWLLDGRGRLVRPMRALQGSSRQNPWVFDNHSNLVLWSTAQARGRGVENIKPGGASSAHTNDTPIDHSLCFQVGIPNSLIKTREKTYPLPN